MLSRRRRALRKRPRAWRHRDVTGRRRNASTLRVRSLVRANGALPPPESARAAGLRYVNDARMPGIRRIGRHTRFRYVDANGRTIADRSELLRIRALVIPPAWTDVWICPDPRGHLQATGRDARGRKQYRYHARWHDVRDEVKYGRLIAFAQALPRIRRRTAADLRHDGLSRRKVLAAVVQLLEKTLIRVGNEEYARDNDSIGLTTMRDRHARVNGSTVRFEFRGKSGVAHAIDLCDARLARLVKACRELPGHELFQYVDDRGQCQVIDSADVNAYLRETTGQDFTSKDFRTWSGTVLAARALARTATCASQAEAKRNIVRAVESVAKRLGNTKEVCRRCYIHPAILDAYSDGDSIRGDEAAVVAIIERRSRKPA